MPPPAPHNAAASIVASGRQMVIAVTGGGSGALAALLETPGASRAVLEAIVPYSLTALSEWIGGQPDQACSEPTARAMAMAAFLRARRLAPESKPELLLGVAATASLATDRPKRGSRRVHLAFQTADQTWAGELPLDGTPADRAADERATTHAVLDAISRGCDVAVSSEENPLADTRLQRASSEETELLLGQRRILWLAPLGSDPGFQGATDLPALLVFPGAFNPRHAGHLRMAEIAERRLKTPVTWELSILNVDKPPLDFIAIRDRVDPLLGSESVRRVALTRAATFLEKAELFPGATFIVGVDTIERIADQRYYGNDASARDAALATITAAGCRFLVFGRVRRNQFATLSDVSLPIRLAALCDEVPAAEFRQDVCSSELRSED